jgi:hypothetical protein
MKAIRPLPHAFLFGFSSVIRGPVMPESERGHTSHAIKRNYANLCESTTCLCERLRTNDMRVVIAKIRIV